MQPNEESQDHFSSRLAPRPLFTRRFVAKSQSRVARPTRGGAQDRGVLEKYVEGLSDEPVGLAMLGSGQACRSSGSAIAAEPSCALEASDLRKHNCCEGE